MGRHTHTGRKPRRQRAYIHVSAEHWACPVCAGELVEVGDRRWICWDCEERYSVVEWNAIADRLAG